MCNDRDHKRPASSILRLQILGCWLNHHTERSNREVVVTFNTFKTQLLELLTHSEDSFVYFRLHAFIHVYFPSVHVYSLHDHLIIRKFYQSCDASTTVFEFQESSLGSPVSFPREDQRHYSEPAEKETRQFFSWSSVKQPHVNVTQVHRNLKTRLYLSGYHYRLHQSVTKMELFDNALKPEEFENASFLFSFCFLDFPERVFLE